MTDGFSAPVLKDIPDQTLWHVLEVCLAVEVSVLLISKYPNLSSFQKSLLSKLRKTASHALPCNKNYCA